MNITKPLQRQLYEDIYMKLTRWDVQDTIRHPKVSIRLHKLHVSRHPHRLSQQDLSPWATLIRASSRPIGYLASSARCGLPVARTNDVFRIESPPGVASVIEMKFACVSSATAFVGAICPFQRLPERLDGRLVLVEAIEGVWVKVVAC